MRQLYYRKQPVARKSVIRRPITQCGRSHHLGEKHYLYGGIAAPLPISLRS